MMQTAKQKGSENGNETQKRREHTHVGNAAYKVKLSLQLGVQEREAFSAEVYSAMLLSVRMKETLIGFGVDTATPVHRIRYQQGCSQC